MNATLRSREQECSVVRNELQSVVGHAQSRKKGRISNFAGRKREVRSGATERQCAVGAAGRE